MGRWTGGALAAGAAVLRFPHEPSAVSLLRFHQHPHHPRPRRPVRPPACLPTRLPARLQLCAEDYLWWWRSYYRGGSISLYVLIYSIGFLVNTLHK